MEKGSFIPVHIGDVGFNAASIDCVYFKENGDVYVDFDRADDTEESLLLFPAGAEARAFRCWWYQLKPYHLDIEWFMEEETGE